MEWVALAVTCRAFCPDRVERYHCRMNDRAGCADRDPFLNRQSVGRGLVGVERLAYPRRLDDVAVGVIQSYNGEEACPVRSNTEVDTVDVYLGGGYRIYVPPHIVAARPFGIAAAVPTGLVPSIVGITGRW